MSGSASAETLLTVARGERHLTQPKQKEELATIEELNVNAPSGYEYPPEESRAQRDHLSGLRPQAPGPRLLTLPISR